MSDPIFSGFMTADDFLEQHTHPLPDGMREKVIAAGGVVWVDSEQRTIRNEAGKPVAWEPGHSVRLATADEVKGVA